MWRVIADFSDLKDNGHVYHVGDSYPAKGEPSPERLKELSGRGNKLGKPLIEECDEPRKTRKKNAE